MKTAMKAARIAAGLSQKELAEMAGVGESSIFNWEKGGCKPTVEPVMLVCDALGISIDSYIGRSSGGAAEDYRRALGELAAARQFIKAMQLDKRFRSYKRLLQEEEGL